MGETIRVRIDGSTVPIHRETFEVLLESSPARERVNFKRTLARGEIGFRDLVDLSRAGDFPYALFFASREVAEAQVARMQSLILEGISKKTFSLNSRSDVTLADVELIVKDLLRKQEALKRLDTGLDRSEVVGALRRSRGSVAKDADALRELLGFTLDGLHSSRGKNGAFEYLVDAFESRQLYVSQSQRDIMLQRLPRGRSFSGLCVKDPKIPYLFVTGGEDGSRREPTGRRVLTLVLLASLVARNKFRAVTFNSQSARPFAALEWRLAEEVLMPAARFKDADLSDLDAVKATSDLYRVTPSATVMRGRRLGMLSHDRATQMLDTLGREYADAAPPPARTPKRVNAVRKYAGTEYTRRMLGFVEAGALSNREFCRVVALNKLKPAQLPDLRASL